MVNALPAYSAGGVLAAGIPNAGTLSGQIFGAGDVVLVAARIQFLMTVFANSPVQTAMITLNGQNISNLGTSRSSDAQANHIYTRAEIEDFIHKNAFN